MTDRVDRAVERRALQICEEALDHEQPGPWALLTYAAEFEAQPLLADRVLELIGEVATLPQELEASLTTVKPPGIGDRIGSYELLDRLGGGGMGTVYRAKRLDSGFEQEVAVKILNARLLSPALVERFAAERRILAALHHPYIAVLIDGGTTAESVPYLVMELVEGEPITRHCDANRLSIRDRLELLIKVAAALQAAHAKFILHQDIKPANVLVGTGGIPKLVDFGIARLTNDGGASEAAASAAGFTADYASPEQIANERVNVVSDVYSLGVLAYELLCGVRPYHLHAHGRQRLGRELAALPTMPPSQRLVKLDAGEAQRIASLRRSTVRAMRASLQGDLDTVLLKAIHPEPDLRYESVSAFATDLRNVLGIRPVNARPATAWYQITTFIRGHRLPALLAGVATVSVVVGLSVALYQARIAQERFTDLHAFSRVVLNDVYDAFVNIPGTTVGRQRLVLEVQHYLDKLAATASGDPALGFDLANAYHRVAQIQGQPSTANLGETDTALTNLDTALRIASSLDVRTPEPLRLLASIRQTRAEILAWQGNMQAALDEMQQSLDLYDRYQDRNQVSENDFVQFAFNHVKAGDMAGHPAFPNAGDPVRAEAAYLRAYDLIVAPNRWSASWRVRRARGVIQERIGTMRLLAGDIPRALEHFEDSLAIRAGLASELPQNQDVLRDHGIALEKIAATCQASGRLEEAMTYYQQALAIYRTLAQGDPENANAQRTLATGLENVGTAAAALNQRQAARDRFKEAVTIRRSLLARDPNASALSLELRNALAALQALE
ncbi:MAG: serine/threonine-protein kinase [Pseudomonadales bacterium]